MEEQAMQLIEQAMDALAQLQELFAGGGRGEAPEGGQAPDLQAILAAQGGGAPEGGAPEGRAR